MVFEEVLVYVVDYVEFAVANRAHEQFLIVGGRGCRRARSAAKLHARIRLECAFVLAVLFVLLVAVLIGV